MLDEILKNQDQLKLRLLDKFKELGFNNMEASKLVVELVFEANKAELMAKQSRESYNFTGDETLVKSSTGKTTFAGKYGFASNNAWEKWK